MTTATALTTAAIVFAFICGSVPMGLCWGKLARGIDVRTLGSRNFGATNVYRVIGPIHGLAVLVLDVGKGAGPVLLARSMTGSEISALLAGLAAILGHIFSPWVGFRGGKGVATGLGVWLSLSPLATLATLGTWGAALALTRRVSIASLVAAVVLPFAVYAVGPAPGRRYRVAFAVVVSIMVWIRHRGNITRIRAGEEPPLWGPRR
jgi:acyl phosphate:glycerol-3-phosphate acyltransferase